MRVQRGVAVPPRISHAPNLTEPAARVARRAGRAGPAGPSRKYSACVKARPSDRHVTCIELSACERQGYRHLALMGEPGLILYRP